MAATRSHRLTMEDACHQHSSFSFDQVLKLADKVDMDEISNGFDNWSVLIINLRVMSP